MASAELQALLRDANDEDSWLSIESATWEGELALTLVFVLSDETRANPPRTYEVRCSRLLECRLTDVRGGVLNHVTDPSHPALRQFLDRWATLYFRGTANSVSTLIGELWCAHREACGDWIDFGRYLNDVTRLEQLVAERHGMLAEGPRFLIERYGAVLERNGITASYVAERQFKRWTGTEWETLDRAPEALHFGNSSVVAMSVEASRR